MDVHERHEAPITSSKADDRNQQPAATAVIEEPVKAVEVPTSRRARLAANLRNTLTNFRKLAQRVDTTAVPVVKDAVASASSSENDIVDPTTLQVKTRVDKMISKIESEIEAVDGIIGENLKVLDTGISLLLRMRT